VVDDPDDPPDPELFVELLPFAVTSLVPAAAGLGPPGASAGAASAVPADPEPRWLGPLESACGAMWTAATAAPVTAKAATPLRKPPPTPLC
jgi:hypothetical protein